MQTKYLKDPVLQEKLKGLTKHQQYLITEQELGKQIVAETESRRRRDLEREMAIERQLKQKENKKQDNKNQESDLKKPKQSKVDIEVSRADTKSDEQIKA